MCRHEKTFFSDGAEEGHRCYLAERNVLAQQMINDGKSVVGFFRRGWDDDGVDDVDDAVGGHDVGGGDLGVVDHDFAIFGFDGDLGAVYGFGV